MKIVKTWCENTEEGKDYLEYNFEATQEEIHMLENGENPFFTEMSDFCNEECGEVEYDFAATDEDTGKVLVEWG